jgi:hypothetical protein
LHRSHRSRPLLLLAWSLAIAERQAHRLLASERVRAEFFKPSKKSLALVARFDWCNVPLLNRLCTRLVRPRGRQMFWCGIRAVWCNGG